jgi:hypothetical protein
VYTSGVSAGHNIVVLAVILTTCAAAQTGAAPHTVNYCDVVASPADYNRKVLFIEVILSPGYHSLSLYGAACVPTEGYDVTTQAVLPDSWESVFLSIGYRSAGQRLRDNTLVTIGRQYNPPLPLYKDATRDRLSVTFGAVQEQLPSRVNRVLMFSFVALSTRNVHFARAVSSDFRNVNCNRQVTRVEATRALPNDSLCKV